MPNHLHGIVVGAGLAPAQFPRLRQQLGEFRTGISSDIPHEQNENAGNIINPKNEAKIIGLENDGNIIGSISDANVIRPVNGMDVINLPE